MNSEKHKTPFERTSSSQPTPPSQPTYPTVSTTSSTISLPAWILDEWMPRLKDTELRILLLVARQRVEKRKVGEMNWISHSQFKIRTGRASEAISAAIESLVQAGLLEVSTPSEDILITPQDRRAYRGCLCYRLVDSRCQRLTDCSQPIDFDLSKKSKVSLGKNDRFCGKPKTTRQKQQLNHVPFRFPKTESPAHVDDIKKTIWERLNNISQ
jgi:hypothetical protein